MPSNIENFHQTVDGHPFRVLATDLDGDLPIAIFVNNEVARLDRTLNCPANEGYSCANARVTHKRYMNFYRAADGSFTPGSRTYATNLDRMEKNDSNRAVFALEITFDENVNSVTARKV